jgi:uncharacterized protein (DUF697 family)
MSNIPAVPTSNAVAAAAHAEPTAGRLAILTGMAVAACMIPVPFVPDRVLSRVRGAVVHDVAARYGLSLTSDAREALAQPNSDRRATVFARKLVETVVRRVLRRLGPLGAASSFIRALEVFALGHLLERYIEHVRPLGVVRIHVDEAHVMRELIDRAVLRALAPSLSPRSMTLNEPAEDLRDELTRWIDTALLTGAALPGYIERRLDAAFDAVVAERPQTHHE